MPVEHPLKAIKITDKVWWVGAIDWAVRDFHGYETSRGTTYNAYLVMGEKITLIDTVKKPFFTEMLARISTVTDPLKIEYIVSNHSEMDHSGCLPEMIEIVKPKKVFASAMGKKALQEHFRIGDRITEVKTGDSVDIGGAKLSFVETRMLHWPDSMITYLDDGGVLFSQDAFGMHLASFERFADEQPAHVLESEAAKYYANILTPFSALIAKFLAELPGLNLDIKIVAPDHGPVWRMDVAEIIRLYTRWSAMKPERKAVVLYDTMWGSTGLMAAAAGEGLASMGIHTSVMKLRSNHRSDVATAMLGAGAFLVGTPTINNNLFPTVADALVYLKGLRFRPLAGAAFGSYGWSGDAPAQVTALLADMKIALVHEGFKVKYVPDAAALEECRNIGAAAGRKLLELIK
jgi:flavorubredoxin